MRFICSQHPKRKGKSLDARLRTESIGISPLRLLYGRAASYGSIINPCTCHRHLREQLGFLEVCRSLPFGRSWRFYNLGLGLPVQGTCLTNVYSVVNVLLGSFPLDRQREWRKVDFISKKIKKIKKDPFSIENRSYIILNF